MWKRSIEHSSKIEFNYVKKKIFANILLFVSYVKQCPKVARQYISLKLYSYQLLLYVFVMFVG